MATTDRMVLGRNRRVATAIETVAGTYEPPVAAGSAFVRDCKVTEKGDKVERRDRQGQSLTSRINRKIEVDVEIESYLLPQGGVLPLDLHAPLVSWFGGAASAGGRYVYSIDDSARKAFSLEMTYEEEDENGIDLGGGDVKSALFACAAEGCVANEFELKFSGSDEGMLTIKAMARRAIVTGTSYVASTEAIGQNVISVNDARQFSVGSRVGLGVVDLEREITAVDIVNNTITIDSALTAEITGGADTNANRVYPVSVYDPDECAGEPTLVFDGSCSLFGSAIEISEVSVKGTRNMKRIADKLGDRYASFFVPGFRQVTGSLTLYSTQANIRTFLQRREDRAGALLVTAVSSEGYDVRVSLPNIELDYDGAVEVPAGPDGGEAKLTIPFVALESAYGAKDEIEISTGDAA